MAENVRESKLRELREAAHLTRAELARLSGVNARTIEAYESGLATPTVPRFRALATALGVSLDELADKGEAA